MREVHALREQAARAKRLAWAATDQAVCDRLRELAEEYRREAEQLEAVELTPAALARD